MTGGSYEDCYNFEKIDGSGNAKTQMSDRKHKII